MNTKIYYSQIIFATDIQLYEFKHTHAHAHKSARNPKIAVDAARETGETWVES